MNVSKEGWVGVIKHYVGLVSCNLMNPQLINCCSSIPQQRGGGNNNNDAYGGNNNGWPRGEQLTTTMHMGGNNNDGLGVNNLQQRCIWGAITTMA